MAKVVGDRTGHLSDRGRTLGRQQFFSRGAQPGAHPVEGISQLSNLPGSGALQLIIEVTPTKGARSCNQPVQRTRDGGGKVNSHRAAQQQENCPQTKEHVVQAGNVLAGLIVGFQNHELHAGLRSAREQYCRMQEALAAKPRILSSHGGSRSSERRTLSTLYRSSVVATSPFYEEMTSAEVAWLTSSARRRSTAYPSRTYPSRVPAVAFPK